MVMITRRLYITNKNEEKILVVLVALIVSFSLYYYLQNRYVELRPVILKEYYQPIILFDNQLYKFAEPNEVPANYYKNIEFVIDHSIRDYVKRDGKIYVRYKLMNDLNLIWNYTNRTGNAEWIMQEINEDKLKLQKFEDSQSNK